MDGCQPELLRRTRSNRLYVAAVVGCLKSVHATTVVLFCMLWALHHAAISLQAIPFASWRGWDCVQAAAHPCHILALTK